MLDSLKGGLGGGTSGCAAVVLVRRQARTRRIEDGEKCGWFNEARVVDWKSRQEIWGTSYGSPIRWSAEDQARQIRRGVCVLRNTAVLRWHLARPPPAGIKWLRMYLPQNSTLTIRWWLPLHVTTVLVIFSEPQAISVVSPPQHKRPYNQTAFLPRHNCLRTIRSVICSFERNPLTLCAYLPVLHYGPPQSHACGRSRHGHEPRTTRRRRSESCRQL